jgi:hypothetical protein
MLKMNYTLSWQKRKAPASARDRLPKLFPACAETLQRIWNIKQL